jgi:outer membrane protein OmpA-like peptidoglycan-associated protein
VTATPKPSVAPTPAVKSGELAFDVYYDLDSDQLTKKAKKVIEKAFSTVRAQSHPQAKISVSIVGWVQPTKNSPNIRALSYWRAKSVELYLKKLGLNATYALETPGHDRIDQAQSRRASTLISWSLSR